MAYQVIFKSTFLADLERIVRSIADDNPKAALNLGKIVIRTAESLKFFPERYPQVRQRPGIRRYVVKKNFKVFYRIQSGNKLVEILRCWDGRRHTDPRF